MLKLVNFDLTPSIEEVIKEFEVNSTSFSAHMVTKELRNQFPNHNIVHDYVKELVHEIMYLNSNFTMNDTGLFKLYEPIIQTSTVIAPIVTQSSSNNDGTSVVDDSSWIKEKCYMKNNELLIIDLNDTVYVYRDVPESVYVNFRKSTSKEKYFNQNIKSQYCRVKLDDAFDCLGVN